MKKLFSLILALALVMLSLAACGETGGESSGAQTAKKKIGIVQIVEHESLDEVRNAILDQLKDDGFISGQNVTIDYQNAQGDQANLNTITQKFTADKVDVIIAIATPSALSAQGATKDIPIVFSAVTDPVSTELVATLDAPGGNITGVSDWVSAEALMDTAQQVTPGIKKLGALYSSSEANSASTVKDLADYCKTKGIELVKSEVANTNEVQQGAEALVAKKVDAVFIPTDNQVASAIATVAGILNKAKIPSYLAADSMVNGGGLMSLGVDYKVVGQETAIMVEEVLGGKAPANMAVKRIDQRKAIINRKTAAALGLTIPEAVALGAVQIDGE